MCGVLEKTTADSALGPVDACKVACGRQQPNEMTFLYAPAIGHYVRMESASTDGEAPLVRRLVSFSRDTGTAVAGAAKTDRTKAGWPADGPEGRRGGNEGVSKGRSRGSPNSEKKKKKNDRENEHK